ncbi:kinesin-like protein NACK2 [Andrographis paniculata]|uniref:kinesin-like protein NACK2 n=1 Tax=Andrographis paniculata TaxID=175694 RepID=UPI0021E8DB78|nr:kinesin-like protein NACK2 [Andrographis paniculata]XP_051113874.1 kinesin-like protein NACK2 [Andrographis paniculata]
MTMGAPVTPSPRIKRTPSCTPGGPKVREENILATVRMRPLSSKELAAYDLVAWDIVDENTIISKNLYHERNAGSSYTFDKVFDPMCSSRKVYEEGARDVALSALNGINATIFAYGQTSSGKTFTMRGIAENAIRDIYEHIRTTPERGFLIKFSALEIYNETVVDLLNRDSGALRLMDDPERGTTVVKLTEETIKDDRHLKQLISICEAQRQVGETALNDKSSRSHQIIRLTIESSLREDSGCVKSFLASLNLVDLAGSERAAQANTDGARLKEGSHINKSLLTLTTVIRKLSGGNRSGHIPYRNSKLTRILQTSLGGNARTAIICTMSPALSHVDQSRNTLLFATSAKKVTNNAQVNMVVEKTRLMKQLQEKVARLEAELQSPDPSASSCLTTLLREKDLKIQQMAKEIDELKHELELERSTHKERKFPAVPDHHGPCPAAKRLDFKTGFDSKVSRKTKRKSAASSGMLVGEIRKLEMRQRQLGEEANRALELLHDEVSSQRIGSQGTVEAIAKMLLEIKQHAANCTPVQVQNKTTTTLREEMARLNSIGGSGDIRALEEKLADVQKSIEELATRIPTGEDTPEPKNSIKRRKGLPFSLSNAANMNMNMPSLIRSPCSTTTSSSSHQVIDNEIENRAPDHAIIRQKREEKNYSREAASINMKRMQRMFKKATEDNIQSIKAYVTELKERVAKLQYQKQLLVCQVLELEEANEAASSSDEAETTMTISQSPISWKIVFEEERKEIVMLWHVCHVSIIHRTQFYLLFKGDDSDQIYMEVELRRLKWLERHLDDVGNASPALLGDDPPGSVSSSIKALKQEREYLAKRVSSKLSAEERETMYGKWDVPADGKQRRRMQLVNKLWTDPLNMQHVKESADVVAKLVGFCESSQPVSREMFELNFAPLTDKKTWMGWNLISNLLHL